MALDEGAGPDHIERSRLVAAGIEGVAVQVRRRVATAARALSSIGALSADRSPSRSL